MRRELAPWHSKGYGRRVAFTPPIASVYEYSLVRPRRPQSQSGCRLESAAGVARRTQPCRPPRPLRSRSNAPTRPVCSPSGFGIRQISHSAPVAPCTAHLCPTPCAQHVQPLNVPVREPVHVQYWAVAWSDRVGLLGLALALRARADIEVCAVGEDAASRQGSSTDGQARSWLARRCSGRSMSSIMEEDG